MSRLLKRHTPFVLTVNSIKFTQYEVDWLKEYCTVRVPPNSGGTQTQVLRKIGLAYPNWKMPSRMTFFKFAYGEGLVKL